MVLGFNLVSERKGGQTQGHLGPKLQEPWVHQQLLCAKSKLDTRSFQRTFLCSSLSFLLGSPAPGLQAEMTPARFYGHLFLSWVKE